MQNKTRKLMAFLMMFLFIGKVFCFPADVEDISGRKYFSAVSDAIKEAEKSILMVMYIVNLDERNIESMVYKLCDAIVKANDRGVKIK